MFNKENQQQQGGNNSINHQAGWDIFVTGISYTDAKAIALDVYRENFLKLSQEALIVADERIEIFVSSFLNKLHTKNPDLLNSLKNPGMVSAVFDAEKEYVRNGSEDSRELLTNLLIKRAESDQRDSMQIALDESLIVVGKLTQSHINTITIVFLLRKTIQSNVLSLVSLKSLFEKEVKPFVNNLKTKDSFYSHLDFTGAGSVSVLEVKFINIFLDNYSGLFNKGLNGEEYAHFNQIIANSEFGNEEKMLIILEGNTIRINVKNRDDMVALIDRVKPQAGQGDILMNMFTKNIMSESEILVALDGFGEYMVLLRDVWDNSNMRKITLTNVGVAIAIANYIQILNKDLDYTIWLGE